MVGEVPVSCNLKSPLAQILKECSGISYCAENHEPGALPILKRQYHSQLRHAKHILNLCRRVKNGTLRVATDDCLDSRRGRLHASSYHYGVGAPQRGHRFAESARGQNHAAAKRVGRIHEYDVSVPCQLQVLETVIQDKPVDPMPREGFAILVPVCAYSDLNFSGEPLPEERDFVTLGQTLRVRIGCPAISAS
jgi:hypothetical protein